MDPDKLLMKLSQGGQLSEIEMKTLATSIEHLSLENLAHPGAIDEAYALVHLASKSENNQLAYLIERYLDAKDPLLVAITLETLCLKWGLCSSYLERVMSFALSESWDYDEDVRQTALKIIGEYLRNQLQKGKSKEEINQNWFNNITQQAVELLFSILNDDSVEDITRQFAYRAICRACGKEWEQIPDEYTRLDLSENSPDIDWSMLEEIKQVF